MAHEMMTHFYILIHLFIILAIHDILLPQHTPQRKQCPFKMVYQHRALQNGKHEMVDGVYLLDSRLLLLWTSGLI